MKIMRTAIRTAVLATLVAGVPAQAQPQPPPPAESQAPGGAAPALASAAVAPGLVPGQSRPPKEWEGLVRKSSGAVLGIGSRWENGALHLENEQFKWITSEGTDRNALIPVASINEQFLVCEKKPKGDCFEWGIKTKDADYRFRDILWRMGPTPKARAIHDYMKVAYPNIAAPTYPVDERK